MTTAIATSAACSPAAIWMQAFDLAAVLPHYAAGLVVLTQNADLLRDLACGRRDRGRRHAAPAPAPHPCPAPHGQTPGSPAGGDPGQFLSAPAGCGHPPPAAGHRPQHLLSRLAADDVAPADAWLAPPPSMSAGLPSCRRRCGPPMKLPNVWRSAVRSSASSCRPFKTKTAAIRPGACAGRLCRRPPALRTGAVRSGGRTAGA